MAFQIHGSIPYNELRVLGIDPSEITDFSATVNPLPLPERVSKKVSAQDLAAYPDIDCFEARRAISDFYSIRPEKIVVTAGMTETIFSMPSLFNNAIQFSPTYYDYAAAFRKKRKKIKSVEFPGSETEFEKAINLLRSDKFDLVIICNPNNPDGKTVSLFQIEKLCGSFPSSVICIDESYQEMSLESESALALTKKYENLLVLKSLTKPFGIGGIRAAYAISSPGIINKIKQRLLPWGVSSIAQRIIPEIFKEWDYYKKQWIGIHKEKNRIVRGLNRSGVGTISSICPFIFVVCENATELRTKMLQKHKISVRDCTSFGMPHYIRVMPSDSRSNDTIIQVLSREILVNQE
ncbi:MAG: aminotransferase class I/II-fold pyridoxal phosphate-dependent enzyme [Fibrobacter sp.]|nr:aminotransferase class I/II-fold pyridoxal phosphate-dependent enzyme [Fibrobacter sp.]